MTTSPVIVEQYITLTPPPATGGQSVAATVRFNSTIPHEIRFEFEFDGLPYTFVIDREALVKGQKETQTGHHVLVGPHKTNKLKTVLVFTPSAEQGGGEPFGMYAARRGLWSILARTLAAVPLGCEEEHLDLDGLVARLLGRVIP